MNYENSLKEIISNHLNESELNSFNLNEINLSYGIDFYDKENGISRIIFMNKLDKLKPTKNKVVKFISAKDLLEALKSAKENGNNYDIDYKINNNKNESIIFTYY